MGKKPPNILLLFTDQQRGDTIAASGNPVIKTPHLDTLASEGVRFTSCFTPSPVCVSARCSLIHGQYPATTGCFDNGFPMPTDRPSMMDCLVDAGYRTHGVGKMHFTPDSFSMRGFQSREHQEELRGQVEGDDYLEFLHENGLEHIYDPMGQRGEMYYIPQPAQMAARFHPTQWIGDRAVSFLESYEEEDPFFLFTSFIHPHPPFSPPTPWNKLYRAPLMPLPKRPPQSEAFHTHMNRHQNRYKYRDNGIDNNLLRCMKAYYYGCISFIDFQVGRIMEALQSRGILDDTLILFSSDHGEFLGDYDCFGKRSMLDSAARIPLLARLPGRFQGGGVCTTPTSLVDIMPTALSAAGVSDASLNMEGSDLAQIAQGEEQDRFVYSQLQKGALGVHMALNEEWKYFYSSPDRREFLINRGQDPDETRNRAGVVFCKDTLVAMRRQLMSFFSQRNMADHLDGDQWRTYPQPEISADPDDGLLIQDAGWAREFQDIPGYST